MKKNQKSWSSNEMQNEILKSETYNPHPKANKKLMKISAKVTGQQLMNNGKYTVYNIIIKTEFNEWSIQKRYSELYALNQSLIRKIPEINKHFPPKRFFKNSEETIDERIRYFNNYLHSLFNEYNIFLFDEVIDFICIDKKILELAISKHTMGNKNKENEPLYDSVKKSIEHLTKNERASSFDNNEGKSNLDILGNNNYSSNKSKDSNINSNLNINIELNKKNNNKENNNSINNITDEFEVKNKNYFSNLLEYENSKQTLNDSNNESPFNKIVEEFLKNLNQKNDNKTAIIKSFEEFLKSGNYLRCFSQNEIIKLFIGMKNYKKKNIDNQQKSNDKKKDNSNEHNNDREIRRAITTKKINCNFLKNKELTKSFGKQKINDSLSYSCSSSSDSEDESSNVGKTSDINNLLGLFSLIGNYNKNILLSVSCLDLLVKLLSNEYNPYAEYYINIFKGRKIYDYESIKLEDIIRSNVGGAKSTVNAMKLLLILFKDDQIQNQYKKIIIKNETVLKRFKIFEKNYYC